MILRRSSHSQLLKHPLKQRAACNGLTVLLGAPVRHYKHQIQIVERVTRDSILRYILADEVGLGKTIEAGLIAKQLLIDQPGAKILVLVPPALESQWQDELENRPEK